MKLIPKVRSRTVCKHYFYSSLKGDIPSVFYNVNQQPMFLRTYFLCETKGLHVLHGESR